MSKEKTREARETTPTEIEHAEDSEVRLVDAPYEKNFLNALHFNPMVWFAPGVMLHELSHAVVLVLCGGRVREIKLWDKKKAYVIGYNAPQAGVLLTSLAPFLLFFPAFYLLSWSFSAFYAQATQGLFWPFLLFWLGLSCTMFAIPSTDDLQNAIKRCGKLRTPGENAVSWIRAIILFIPMLVLEALLWIMLLTVKPSSSLRMLIAIGFVYFASLYGGYAV
ncbi:MAG: hypothetical protein ACP5O3_00710 [Candidatus Micrarchaeia archaeon]|jgi:hypothetical protein